QHVRDMRRRRHGGNVDIEPVIALGAVGRDEPMRLAQGRQAQQAGHGDVAGEFAGRAALGRLAVLRDEAAIDQDGGAVGHAERRDHLISRATVARGRAEIELLIVGEAAADADAVILERPRRSERLRQRDRRRGDGGMALGDQALFPEQALDLPGAEPEQDEERTGRPNAWPERRAAAARGGPRPAQPGPPSARWRYWSAMKPALNGRNRAIAPISTTGVHSTAWTQSGGEKVNSTVTASAATTAPSRKTTNTIGPS